MPLYPIINYIILAFLAFVLVVLALTKETRVALFVTPVWFVILIAAYKIKKPKNHLDPVEHREAAGE